MARIRSIKPEFFTSEQLAECSPNARLLFIGLWCFCDDYGVHPAKVFSLKMQVFPADPFTKEQIRTWIDELILHGLLVEYEIEGDQFWFVTGWDKHQKPDTKTGKWPRPSGEIGRKVRRKFGEYSAAAKDDKPAAEPDQEPKNGDLPLSGEIKKVGVVRDIVGINDTQSRKQVKEWISEISADDYVKECFTRARKVPAGFFDGYMQDFALEAMSKAETYHKRSDVSNHFLNYSASKYAIAQRASAQPATRKPVRATINPLGAGTEYKQESF